MWGACGAAHPVRPSLAYPLRRSWQPATSCLPGQHWQAFQSLYFLPPAVHSAIEAGTIRALTRFLVSPQPPPQGPAYALSAHLPNLIPTVSPRGQALLVETLPWLSITVVDNVPVSESTTASWTWLAAMGCAAHLPFRREPVDRSFQLQCPQDLCLSLSHGHTLPGSNNQWLCPTGALGPDSFCPMQDSFDSQSLF